MKTSFSYGPSNDDPEVFEFTFLASCTKKEAMDLAYLIQGMYRVIVAREQPALTGHIVTPEAVDKVDVTKYLRA